MSISSKNTQFLSLLSSNSPSDFVAQIGTADDFQEFGNFLLKIDKWCNENLKEEKADRNKIENSTFCLVKYISDCYDNIQWKRARILERERNQNRANLFLFDEGVCSSFGFDDIHTTLPIFFNEYEPQAKHCKLKDAFPSNATTEWDENANEFFKSLVSQTGLTVTYEEKSLGSNSLDDLYLHDYIVEINKSNVTLLEIMILNGYAFMREPAYLLMSSNDNNIKISAEKEATQMCDDTDDSISSSHISSSSNSSASNTQANKSPESNDVIVIDDQNEIIREVYSKPGDYSKKIRMSKSGYFNLKNEQSLNLAASGNCHPSSSPPRFAPNKSEITGYLDDSELFSCKGLENYSAPVLTQQSFICSDDTILTGYRPNIKMNEKKLAKEIKLANSGALKESSIKSITSPSSRSRLNSFLENQVFQIISGDNGLYPNIESQAKELNRVNRANTNSSPTVIINCILLEMQQKNVGIGYGLNLMDKLKFCNGNNFSQALRRIINEIDPDDPSHIVLAASQRESICWLLAKLYEISSSGDDYKFLRGIPNYCSAKIQEWILINSFTRVSMHNNLNKLRNVKDFLSNCIDHFKKYDLDIFKLIYEKARSYLKDLLDSVNQKEIKNECLLIMDLFAFKYINQDSNDEQFKENSKNDQREQSYDREFPPIAILGFDRNNNKRKSSSDFLRYLTDNDF